jgi:2-keto-3-deoxy-L-fuconate dehydrogenase
MYNNFNLEGKVALITGGGSGIGRSIALLFAKAGANVVIIDQNKQSALSVVNEVTGNEGSAKYIICDISKIDEIESAIESLQTNIDILVNNAGIAHIGTVESTTEEDFDRLYDVNVKGTFNCIKTVIGRMLLQGGGVILNMASIAGMIGLPDRFGYSMTKGAVIAMTYSVARDYVQKGIRCNSISPARIHTPFVDGFLKKNYAGSEREIFEKLSKTQPIGRMGTADEVAEMALYLCSDHSSFITGNNFPIDGGFLNLNT